jgi:hypothetical protein
MLDLREAFFTPMEMWKQSERPGDDALLPAAVAPLVLGLDAQSQQKLLAFVRILIRHTRALLCAAAVCIVIATLRIHTTFDGNSECPVGVLQDRDLRPQCAQGCINTVLQCCRMDTVLSRLCKTINAAACSTETPASPAAYACRLTCTTPQQQPASLDSCRLSGLRHEPIACGPRAAAQMMITPPCCPIRALNEATLNLSRVAHSGLSTCPQCCSCHGGRNLRHSSHSSS